MNPIENLHYAIGELVYAIATADGKIQRAERDKFHEIVISELGSKHYDFDISENIFQLLDRDKCIDTDTAYNWAIKEIRMNSHYLSPEMKTNFINVVEKIALAFSEITAKENSIIERFKKDIEPLHGDPIYYK